MNAGGRSYSYSTLIPGLVQGKLIIECNLRCACSVRRCTNRVVSKGLSHRLQVFRPVKVVCWFMIYLDLFLRFFRAMIIFWELEH
jgi:hypothetical protein